MTYLIVTIINFLLIYFSSHFFLWNENANSYWSKEKDYKRPNLAVWVWIIIILIGLAYWAGFICCMIVFISFICGTFMDDDVIIDPKLSNWFMKTWLGRFIKCSIKLLNKKVSI